MLQRILHAFLDKLGHVLKIYLFGDEPVNLDNLVGKEVDCTAHLAIAVCNALDGELL